MSHPVRGQAFFLAGEQKVEHAYIAFMASDLV